MNIFSYQNDLAVSYARAWAYLRNPDYYNFDLLGGDCTNFVSQCLFAGCSVMNYTPTLGWYYNSLTDRAPAWTGVNEFYNFLVSNRGQGPFAKQTSMDNIIPGDIIQLSNGNKYYHTVLVTKIENGKIYTASHTRDTLDKNLLDYRFSYARYLHVEGYRK